jgi:hypothetical protein
MSFPPGTEMFQFPGFASCAYGFSARYPCGWVAPFGDPRIKACSRLPGACRSVPRPSSPLGAKASTRCPCFPRPTPATTAPRPAKGRVRRSPTMGESNNLQKAYPCFLDARPRRKRRRACVHACQRPLAQRRTKAQRPALVPANGLSSPLHDVKDRAAGVPAAGRPARKPKAAPGSCAPGQAGKGFPWAFGARTGQAAHRGAAAPPGAATERWWAWADLNGRPHAYQACALTS